MSLILSSKFKDFMSCYCRREYLEGTTAAGKTTVGIAKFMLRVSMSQKKDHILAGIDIGTVEKNIINSELGILSQFAGLAKYNASGKGKVRLPHIEYNTQNGIKIIYVAGMDNKSRWEKVLGSQVGCVYIDEVNIADMEFVREITHRCEYMMTTSNPDDPSLSIYKEFINRSRPLKRYVKDYPEELLAELNEPPVRGWVHWYFTFNDNAALTKEQIADKVESVPVGTKMYKNKIQGLRGRATGLVFPNFSRKKNVISYAEAKEYIYRLFSCGVDTAYSNESPDTISFTFGGITTCGKYIVLDEMVLNNRDRSIPLAPSDVAEQLDMFLQRNLKDWGYPKRTYVDSADQATLSELKKRKREQGSMFVFENAWKKKKVTDRIHLQLGWIQSGNYLVLEHCKEHIREIEIYSWKEDKYEPEDRNDHTVNSCQYSWLPYEQYIGIKQKKE